MIKVNDHIFYHIHATGNRYDNLWFPGSTFNVGRNGRNEFIEYYDTATIGVHLGDNETIPMSAAIRYFRKKQNNELLQNCQVLLEQAEKAIKEMGSYIREIIFEEIRQNEFPEHPSRMRSIWVCDESDISYWFDKVHSRKKTIYRVKLTGNIHRAANFPRNS